MDWQERQRELAYDAAASYGLDGIVCDAFAEYYSAVSCDRELMYAPGIAMELWRWCSRRRIQLESKANANLSSV